MLGQLITVRNRLLKIQKQLEVPLNEIQGQLSAKAQKDLCYEKVLQAVRERIKKADKQIKQTVKKDKTLARHFNIATSVEGVGPITAAMLIVSSNEFQKFATAKKMACNAGIAPFKRSSGTSVKGRTRISQLANKPLKSILHMGALTTITGNTELATYFKRKVALGKPKKSVINALKNKIIHRVYACIRDNRLYKKNLVATIQDAKKPD